MAEAVKELYPGTQVTFGPATETGFYYDFARDDAVHARGSRRASRRACTRSSTATRPSRARNGSATRAVAFFAGLGEKYKAEWIDEIPKGEAISLYRQGEFVDLCRGPHLPSTGKLGHAFKLTKVAGAYWRGDARNAQLQRIYGTAWATEKELRQYLFQLEEAEKRDHRRIGPRARPLPSAGRGGGQRCSGIRRAGRSTAPSRPISAAGSSAPAMSR